MVINQSKSYLEDLFSLESFLIGGISIIVCMAFWMFTGPENSIYMIAQFAFIASFVVNYPHFLSSYVMIYSDFRDKLFTKPRFYFNGVLVPILLAGYLMYALINLRDDLLSYGARALFVLLGWHYVKQIFGCIMVTSVRRGVFYQGWEKKIFLFNLFSIWGISWLNGNVGERSFDFYGISYTGFNLPEIMMTMAYWIVGVSFLMVIVAQFRKYIYEGKVMPAPAVVALLSIYVWYIPTFFHPAFNYLIPFFHSLQYFVFVWSYKKNEVTAKAAVFDNDVEKRKYWVKNFVGYLLFTAFLGAMAFEFVPKYLDSELLMFRATGMGQSPVLVVFLLFINIHHYFIDSAMWRSDNEEMRKYLFANNPQQPDQRLISAV